VGDIGDTGLEEVTYALDDYKVGSAAPLIVFDADNDVYVTDGQNINDISAFTATGAGGYYLDTDLGDTGEYTVAIDYTLDNDVGTPTGQAFSWTSGWPGGNRVEFGTASAFDGTDLRLYVNPGDPSANYAAFRRTSKDGEGGGVNLEKERTRAVFTVASNEATRYQINNGEPRDVPIPFAALSTPSRLGIGCRAWASGTPDADLTDGEVHRVVVWPRKLTDAQIAEYCLRGDRLPIHLVGDSFLNVYGLFSELSTLLSNEGLYVPMSQDGIGGTTLTQQAERFAAYSGERAKWYDSTLIIVDGGFEGSEVEGIPAVNSMVSNLTHDRWLYIQSAPSGALSSEEIAQGGTNQDLAMQAEFPDNYVPTLERAWAESDGSPTDEDQIALGRWPVSLTGSASDFHPNEAGRLFLANVIRSELRSRGWA